MKVLTKDEVKIIEEEIEDLQCTIESLRKQMEAYNEAFGSDIDEEAAVFVEDMQKTMEFFIKLHALLQAIIGAGAVAVEEDAS